jgi:type IV pilus assembly protein PilY1
MKASFHLRRAAAATFAAALAICGAPSASAEDIDIFTAGSGVSSKPNILILLDNSSNWSATLGNNSCMTTPGGNMNANTKFAAEMCALYKVVGNLDQNVRLGLMMFTESGDAGAYVRFGIRDMNATNKLALRNMLTGFISNGSGTDNSGSSQPYAKAMMEVFKYFGGYTSPAHATDNVAGSPLDKTHFGPLAFAGGADNGSVRRDYRNNNTPANRAAAFYAADVNYALDSNSQNSYTNPIVDICAKNFLIFISNGNPSTGGDSGTNPARDTAILTNVGATTSAYPTAATEIHASKMDEMALFLKQTDVSAATGKQPVTTYTIAVYQPSAITYTYAADGVTITGVASETISNTDQAMIALMKSAANLGGGKYFAGRDADSVARAIELIINEVQAVNSVFVSASLPVSVNNQGTFLNQVYMGMFRPDGSGQPRWLGNLKEYKFILDATTGAISLADAKTPPTAAVNPSTGFISPSAWSFWSRRGDNPAGTGWPAKDFWVNNPAGTPPNGADALNTTQGDGEVVEKGGAGEMMRIDFATSQTTRTVLTCPSTGCTAGAAPSAFNTTTVTGASYQAAFGAATAGELTLLVNWIRGADNFNGAPCDPSVSPCAWSSAEAGPGWPATVRPSIHGDVLHSRPVVLNYGGSGYKSGPWVFYGANDGMLRAVKGGQDNAIAAKDGHEAWSFIPIEFYGKYKRLRDASPELRTPGTPALIIPLTAPKDYFFDGPIGVWEDPDGTTKWIFVTARRGGPVIYAFDVSDPSAPLFMWKKTQTDLPNLGQAWSTPWAFKLTGDADPTLLFGAGYDVGEDLSPAVPNANIGKGIYVLNARTGAVKSGGNVVNGFWQTGVNASIADSIPSDVSLITNTAGQVYRGYVGDTAGNLWRLDIPSNTLANWKLNKFATLGPGKKFFYGPDVVHAGGYDVVLAGTGDREKPLDSTSSDSFYALNDVNWDPAVVPPSVTAMTTANLVLLSTTSGITSGSGGTCRSGVCSCEPPSCMGWYRNLTAGEKVVNSPLTVAGVTYFSTNRPAPPAAGTCNVNLGEARAYGFTFFGGTPNKTQPDGTMGQPLTGGGLPPSPVGGVVEIEPGKNVAFIIGAGDKGSSVEGGRITIPVASTRRKVYWNAATDK